MLIAYWLYQLHVIQDQYTMIYIEETLLDFLIAVLFSWHLKKRKGFIFLYLFIALVVMLAFSFALGAMRAVNPDSILYRIFATFFIFLELLGMILACYQERDFSSILSWNTALIAKESIDIGGSLIYILAGVNPRLSFVLIPGSSAYLNCFLYDIIRVLLGILVYLPFRKRPYFNEDKETMKRILFFTLGVLSTVVVLQTFLVQYSTESIPLYTVCLNTFFVLCAALIVIRTNILSESKYRQEAKVMNQVIASEEAQYNSLKTNIEVINMKAHDIKHQLEKYQDKLTEDEINHLRKSVEAYDMQMKTGNQVLDTVLYSTSLRANKEKVRFTCLADGQSLNGFDDATLYYLFSNILDNAFEALKNITDPDKRVISLNVSEEQNKIHIEECNFFQGERKIEGGLIPTSKEDKTHHGYGLKSIRFLVNENKGAVSLETKGDMFFLRISLPKPKDASADRKAS